MGAGGRSAPLAPGTLARTQRLSAERRDNRYWQSRWAPTEPQRDKFTPVSVGVDAVDPGPTPDPDPDPGPGVRYPTLQAMTTAPEFSVADANTLRLYNAFFLRTPEIGGANYWIDLTRQGASLDTLAYQFAVSSEFKSRYGSLDNR